MEDGNSNLHLIMLPWLAMGHLLPFFEFSKRLAAKGHRISFFSTAGNLRRLPPIPPPLTPLLHLIPIKTPFSNIDNTSDLRSDADRLLLHQTYAAFETHLTAFLSDDLHPKPDWIIHDFTAASWAPTVAARFEVGCAFLSLVNAAVLAFFDRPLHNYTSPEDLTKVPDRIPFPTTVAFRHFEARQFFDLISNNPDSSSKNPKIAAPIQLMLVRSCWEFESKWLDLVVNMHKQKMQVVAVGFLPPFSDDENETWLSIRRWLDRREVSSVIYTAFGTEAKLTEEQIGEIALGLERSEQPFIWALRIGSPPEGFEERNAERGMVCRSWVPQSRILGHPAVGGFLTHGGWNSVVEGIANGVAMAVLPMVFDQGLNARHLVELEYAVEVERDEDDGCFSGEEIARKLRMVMVEEEGEEVRTKARKGKKIFGNEKLQSEYDAKLVKQLWDKRV